MIKQLRLFSTLLLLAVASMAWAGEETITFSEKGYANGDAVESVSGTDFTITFDKGTNSNAPKYYTTGKAVRVYGGNTFTVNSEKTITNIALTFASGEGSNEITTDKGNYNNGKWSGAETNVVFSIGGASGHRRIVTITVTTADGQAKTPAGLSFSETSLTVNVGEEPTFPTLDNPNNLPVSYASSNESVATVNAAGEISILAAGETTISATSEETDTYYAGYAFYTLTVVDPNGPGSENNPYTVTQARAAIDTGTGVKGVYVSGIVSEIVTPFNAQYGNISFNISEDGTTEAEQLQAFRCFKGANNEHFESADDVMVGDKVVLLGNLTIYNSTYELEAGNYIVSLERENAKESAGISYSASSYTATMGEANEFPTLANPNNLTVTYTSSNTDVATISAEGNVTIVAAGTTTIKATTAEDDNYYAGEASYVLSVVDPNAPGMTADNPFTVADVLALYENNEVPANEVYVKGIISRITSLNPPTYTNARYYISDDGTQNGEFYVYNGKYLDGADFTANDQIMVGDEVVVYGKLTTYSGTNEFAAGNYIVSLNRPEQKETPEILFQNEAGEAVTKVTLRVGESTTLTVLPEDLEMTFTNSDETVATWENGTITALAAGTSTITANFAGNDTYNAATATLTVVVKEQQPVVEGKSFVKVTSKSELTDGNYLIVYEEGSLAFDGGLETLDAAGNTIGVDIVENTITANDANKAAVFTLANTDEVYTLLSASGLYIGQTTNANGLKAQEEALYNTISFGEEGEANIVSGGAYLRYNAASNQTRFRYYKSDSYTGQKAVCLYKLTDQEPIASKVDPELSFETTAFNVEPNAEFTAPVLANPYEVTVAYSTSDAEIAAVNETTGAVTIGEKEGTATITASFEGDETYKAATASYTITVKAAVVPGTDKYELVTDATTLKAGDEILIAYVDDEGATVMGEQKSNNRAGVEATLNADMTITPNTDAQVITLEGETDAWYFNVGDGYLYAAGNEKNYLKTETEADDNAKATIAIAKNETTEAVEATIQFQGSYTRNLMRFNPNNGSPIFACYSSTSGTGSLPQLYRKVAESENKKGDVNNDGSVTIADVTTLVNIILGKNDNYNSEVADVNEDGSITIADVTTLVNIILGRAN